MFYNHIHYSDFILWLDYDAIQIKLFIIIFGSCNDRSNDIVTLFFDVRIGQWNWTLVKLNWNSKLHRKLKFVNLHIWRVCTKPCSSSQFLVIFELLFNCWFLFKKDSTEYFIKIGFCWLVFQRRKMKFPMTAFKNGHIVIKKIKISSKCPPFLRYDIELCMAKKAIVQKLLCEYFHWPNTKYQTNPKCD